MPMAVFCDTVYMSAIPQQLLHSEGNGAENHRNFHNRVIVMPAMVNCHHWQSNYTDLTGKVARQNMSADWQTMALQQNHSSSCCLTYTQYVTTPNTRNNAYRCILRSL